VTLLLDTHAVLWWLSDDPRLGQGAREAIAGSPVAVSAISHWEIEIKRAAGRLEAPADLRPLLDDLGFTALAFTAAHAVAAGRLPAHHADPFDRALLAQASLEGLRLVTADAALRAYDTDLLPADR